MESFNQALFLFFNASAYPDSHAVTAAFFLADYAIWLVPLGLVISWLRGGDTLRSGLIEASAAALTALFFAQIVGALWPHPRPFMIGLGTNLMPHIADPSMPSDHLTFLWTIAASLTLHRRTRSAGAWLALLGLPIAWSRLYLGVHFPFDMLASALLAVPTASLAKRAARWFTQPVLYVASAVYRTVFAALIRRGWVAP